MSGNESTRSRISESSSFLRSLEKHQHEQVLKEAEKEVGEAVVGLEKKVLTEALFFCGRRCRDATVEMV